MNVPTMVTNHGIPQQPTSQFRQNDYQQEAKITKYDKISLEVRLLVDLGPEMRSL